jgi:hypothetical protein
MRTDVPVILLAHHTPQTPPVPAILNGVQKTTMVFLTYPHHGCVYTLSQEDGDELYYAPIYSNGNVNLEEFAPVDLDSVDMDQMEIFDIRNRLVELSKI